MQTKGKAEHIRKLPEIVYDEVLSEQQTETEDSSTKGIHAGDVYQYFDFKALRASVELPEKSRRRANQIKKDRNLKILEASDGYVGALGDAPACAFRFRGQENLYRRKSPVDVDLLLSKDKVLRAECSCHECYEARYYWSQKSNCGFIAAALDMAIDHLKEHSRLDVTDKLAVKVIHNFAEKRRSQIISENRRQESSVVLEPRIVLKDEEIGLSFKVGDDKLFVVKDLYHFTYLVKNSSTEVYGSSKVINHGIQNFTPFSEKWVKFILDCVAGGVGLNLTGADVVFHYDPWWNVAVQSRATDRAHRIGQTKKVTVYKMIAKGTIEEKIVKLQETKKNLADQIINGENVGLGSMTREDLMELLGV